MFIRLLGILLLASIPTAVTAPTVPPGDWLAYGRTIGGDRHSPLTDIRPDNVARLEVAWRFSTGEWRPEFATKRDTRFEATPLAIDGILYLSTPLGRAFALDGATGKILWSFDAQVPRALNWGDFANRGVAYWEDKNTRDSALCAKRILLPTIDARLIALDAVTGRKCPGFGLRGVIDLRRGLRNAPSETEEYQLTSPPAVVGDVVVVGSSVADNNRIDAASGEVRGFDARSGELLWTWDPVAQHPEDPAYESWIGRESHRTGGGNVWSVMVADPELGLVYLPTTSPSPDYYGGRRWGDNRNASSIVALDARTGRLEWAFQTVHHDIWDYDNAAPPALVEITRDGRTIPALVEATKTGQLFILDRRDGRPIFPVEERPVPRSDAKGERTSPTQPFSAGLAELSPNRLDARPWSGLTEADRRYCATRFAELRYDGPFTPPSEQGSLILPSNIGGVAWGGVSYDPARRIIVAPTNRIAAIVRLVPTEELEKRDQEDDTRTGLETTVMHGTPYAMQRELYFAPSGLPCTKPPYGSLHAIDLATGKTAWNVPLGGLPRAPNAGGIVLGGPISTASGLTFIGAASDGKFRAFDTTSGRLLWSFQLNGMARSTPMTFRARDGRQIVAVAAGASRNGQNAELVAFALPG